MDEKNIMWIVGGVVLVLALVAGGVLLLKSAPSAVPSTVPPTGTSAPAGTAPVEGEISGTALPGELRPSQALARYEARVAAGEEIPLSRTGRIGGGGTGGAGDSAGGGAGTATGGSAGSGGAVTGAGAGDAGAAGGDAGAEAEQVPGIPPTDREAFVAQIIDDNAQLRPDQKEQELTKDVMKRLEELFDRYIAQIERDRRAQLAAYAEAHRLRISPEQAAALELEWLQYRSQVMIPYLQKRIELMQELLPLLDEGQKPVFNGNLNKHFVQLNQYRSAMQGKVLR